MSQSDKKIIHQKIVKVGDRVIIDNIEWKIAEIKGHMIILYHKDVDGSGQTILKSVAEVKNLLSSKFWKIFSKKI